MLDGFAYVCAELYTLTGSRLHEDPYRTFYIEQEIKLSVWGPFL